MNLLIHCSKRYLCSDLVRTTVNQSTSNSTTFLSIFFVKKKRNCISTTFIYVFLMLRTNTEIESNLKVFYIFKSTYDDT